MRKYLFFLVFVLFGCSSDSESVVLSFPAQYEPFIGALVLSPNTVSYMDGGGSVVVTVSITYWSRDGDVQALWLRTPDGASQVFDEIPGAQTGEATTFTEDLVIPTDRIGEFYFEAWLVDGAGNRSNSHFSGFDINWDTQDSDWTSRSSGMPALNDVIWDGAVFVAVGSGGTVLTSADGIDWVARASGTEADLYAIAFDGADIFAVGEDIVMLSTDHGESWTTKHEPDVDLIAVAVSPTQVVVGGADNYPFGSDYDGSAPTVSQVMISEDRGDTWQDADSLPGGGNASDVFEDLIYRDGLFVAVTGDIQVSSDGKTWNEITEAARGVAFSTIVHDGARFIAAGYGAVLLTSIDGYNWTETQTPVKDGRYFSAAWNGSELMLSGGLGPQICVEGVCPPFEGPHGIASTDGGVTWEVFNIDSPFEDGWYDSLGLAWGNGSFVSVGRFWPSGEGAIFTAD
jgi:hypothetical protein